MKLCKAISGKAFFRHLSPLLTVLPVCALVPELHRTENMMNRKGASFPLISFFLAPKTINFSPNENKTPSHFRDMKLYPFPSRTGKNVGSGCRFHQECALSDPKSVCRNETCRCAAGLMWGMGSCQVNGQYRLIVPLSSRSASLFPQARCRWETCRTRTYFRL